MEGLHIIIHRNNSVINPANQLRFHSWRVGRAGGGARDGGPQVLACAILTLGNPGCLVYLLRNNSILLPTIPSPHSSHSPHFYHTSYILTSSTSSPLTIPWAYGIYVHTWGSSCKPRLAILVGMEGYEPEEVKSGKVPGGGVS